MLKELQNLIVASRRPYVAVDEAKKALFGGARLSAFHFVVYFEAAEGPNWLVSASRHGSARVDMKQWAEIFGAGFVPVFAVRRAGGIAFRTLAGEPLTLTPLPASSSAPLLPSATPKTRRRHPSAPRFSRSAPPASLPTPTLSPVPAAKRLTTGIPYASPGPSPTPSISHSLPPFALTSPDAPAAFAQSRLFE